MNLTPFEQLLHASIGLDVASVGAQSIERAVLARMRALALTDAEAYWQRVCLPGLERQLLIEAVVVPETWFFRDPQAFVALAAHAQDWLQRHPEASLHVLSVPCSTGEEAYSIAMALLDAGIQAARFRVTAVDISEHALELARAGSYGRNAFRSGDLAFRDRHFLQVGSSHHVRERVRAQVDFQRGNLLTPGLLPDGTRAAAVFCRNLLIYFDRATQARALEMLQRLLEPDGALFVAPSEAGLALQSGFDSLGVPLAFGFRRQRPGAKVAPPPRVRKTPPPERPRAPAPTAKPKVAIASSGLEDARALADSGQLAAAMLACQRLLQEHPASAEAHYLYGLVRDAAGSHALAAQQYRKALYLDPAHHEALVHLALLLEHQGDLDGARRLRERLDRRARTDSQS